MIISRLFLWFVIYSVGGWIFECSYCILTTGKWENRGFLFGPMVPIYGVGAVTITVLYRFLQFQGIFLKPWQVFLVAFLGSIVLEYGTSWFLEKKFHAVWWDYSNMPLNVNGRICLPASILFGLAGLFVIYICYPWLDHVTRGIPMLLVEAISLLTMAFVAADTTITISALTSFEKMVTAMEAQINNYMENKVDTLHGNVLDATQKLMERERMFTEQMENIYRQTNGIRLTAIQRIQGYRFDMNAKLGSARKLEVMNKALEKLKKRVRKK